MKILKKDKILKLRTELKYATPKRAAKITNALVNAKLKAMGNH